MALRRKLLSSVLLPLALVLGVVGPTAAPAGAAPAPTTGWRFLDLTMRDGVRLKANLIAPTTPGPHPAIVFVASWGLSDAQFLVQAKNFAEAGYVVLSYTVRGFWGSGGEVDVAGPAEVADLSTVIDWVDANTDADPARIGVAGVSYGAGISLLAAGRDRRIRAVVAMSGWSDMIESLYGNQTLRPQAIRLLHAVAHVVGRPSADFTRMADDYFANRNIPRLIDWGRVRSARTNLAGVNASSPAILIAHPYGDSVFGPNQMIDFFNTLTGPKRLELAPGDHAVPELTGLAGLANHVWTSARRWFDEHLAGRVTGISEEPVVLRVRNNGGAVESYPDPGRISRTVTRYHLGDVPRWHRTGPLSPTPATGWTESFRATGDTVAYGGVAMLSNGLEALTGIPPLAWLPAVNRDRGAVWSTPALPAGAAVRGTPEVHLTVKPGTATGTLVSYLYDVDAFGTGRLITHAPASWHTAEPGEPMTLDARLPVTAWDVPAGHRLALVVDTEDPLYLDVNPHGATVSVTGGSWVDVPLK